MGPLRSILSILKARRKERIMSGKLVLGKGLLQSKTFWVNALTGIASILSLVGSISFLPVTVVPWLGAALAVVNILLRTVTNEPITSIK